MPNIIKGFITFYANALWARPRDMSVCWGEYSNVEKDREAHCLGYECQSQILLRVSTILPSNYLLGLHAEKQLQFYGNAIKIYA